jgi:hypothetical protein
MASFPECTVKAAVWRALVDRTDAQIVDDVARAVPPALAPFVRGELPDSNWVPEVHMQLAALEVRVRAFSSHQQFYDFTLDINRRILKGPLYRALAALLSPSRMLKGAQLAWSRMHQGTSVELSFEPTENRGVVTFFYPRGLLPPTFVRCFPTAAIASLEAGGAAGVDAVLRDHGETRAIFDVHWR